MALSPQLITLAHYLAGEFNNRDQAIAEPIWFVHLCLWQRPVPLFCEDSLTLFAEQANVLKLDQPYRQRLLRLQSVEGDSERLQVQYYGFKDPGEMRGAGRDPDRLQALTGDQIDFLPGCRLEVTWQQGDIPRFHARLSPDSRCCFSYGNETFQVSLGFEASADEFLSYDKGIDPQTGTAIWGALMGPYRFTQQQSFAGEWGL